MGKFIKENIAVIILFLVFIAVLEFICYDPYRITWSTANLVEQKYDVEDSELTGFNLENGLLVSQSSDPYITLYPDTLVKAIAISCSSPAVESLRYVYYRSEGEYFSDERSINFSLTIPQTVVEFPQVIDAESIRLDLTNRTGDVLNCQGFTINPKPSYTALTLRIFFYLLILTWWALGRKYIDPAQKEKIRTGFYRYALLIFIVALIGIDLLYTITLTYDSGQYLWLADVIKQGTWTTWYITRYIGFPLNIFLTQSILGYSTTALLIPMIIAHACLFVISYFIIIEVFNPRSENTRLLIMTFLFLFIALDPTVMGYYHTLLTEYVAATIAITSCFAAILLYKAPLFSKRFYFLTTYFLVMVPVAWHMKQPYIGAALFPFLMVCLLMLIQQFTKKTILYVLISGTALAILILGSTAAWNGFLKLNGNAMKEERRLSTITEERIDNRSTALLESPISSMKLTIKRYLKITNVVQLDENMAMMNFSLTRGFQNKLIAHRMFLEPYFYNDLSSERWQAYVYYLQDRYTPPQWLNKLFRPRLPVSNFLFTVTLLLLPFYVIFQFVFWLKRKTSVNALLLILSGSALLNALLHLLANQIDRYLFWGYPLSLLVLTILLFQLVQKIATGRQRETSALGSEN